MQTETTQPRIKAREISDEIFRLFGQRYDAGYISNLRVGCRHSSVAEARIAAAIESLSKNGGAQ